MSETKVKRVTCAIIQHEGKILLARRKADDAQGGLWEFPGGKVEPGETEEECLLRELDEELGIGVEIERFFIRHRFPIKSGELELVAFLCRMTSPPTRLEAHSEVAWVLPGDLLKWELMPADVGIAERLII
jgi:8-oxo-dGTP diphosphatase